MTTYEFGEVIATSTRSLVRKAIRSADGKRVVVKEPVAETPPPGETRQLEIEYRLLRKLDVPGVVQAVDLEKTDRSVKLVLEDFGGRSLTAFPKPCDLSSFFEIALQAAAALGSIHEHGIVHTDVAPKNLLWNAATRELKIVDFHSAIELTREAQEVSTIGIQGSLPYMSPEQTGRMNRGLDYRTDYYSLGVTFFELLTGRLPFEAGDALGWVHCHISKRPPQARRLRSAIPQTLSDLVDKLLAKDPDARYQSAYGLKNDLRRCSDAWERTRQIEPFPLGADDVSSAFRVPQKLFGRENEERTLVEAFADVRRAARLVLVTGPAGSGKSSLVRELQRSIADRGGRFAAGKCEALERNVPYAALVQALGQVVRQVLAESDDRLARWRQDILDALGANVATIVALVPELEGIVGAQPRAADVTPTEAQHRFLRTFRAFIRVFARPDHPLVVFLDDMQWMDASTPNVIVDWIAKGNLTDLLVVGAYRENEVSAGHPLAHCVKEIGSERPGALGELTLGTLGEAAVRRLVAETLRCTEVAARALAKLVFEKTDGNPFFVHELLADFHRGGIFAFDAQRGRWTWNIGAAAAFAVSDDVAELMVQRLRRLPAEAIAVLEAAACIGGRFDLDTLARATGRSTIEAAAALREPIAERIVVPFDGDRQGDGDDGAPDARARFRFQHDRVQQAAYSLLEAHEREGLHLRIGRLLLDRDGAGSFDALHHLNFARSLIVDPEQRAELSRLNYEAGQRAKRSAAFAIAADYLRQSAECLPPSAGPRDARRFTIVLEEADCAFLSGSVERAGRLAGALVELAHDDLSTAAVYLLKTRVLAFQGDLVGAIAATRVGLHALSVELPEDRAVINASIGEGIARMQAHLVGTPVETLLDRPLASDPAKVMTLNLLFQVIPSAIQTYPPLFILAELWMFDLALRHGIAAASCKNFVDCGIIQGAILGDYERAYRLGQVAFKLLDRLAPTSLDSSVHFVFGAFVSHWRAPYEEGWDAFARAEKLGLESGDIDHVAYTRVHRGHRLVYVGRPLAECDAENEATVAFLQGARAVGQLAGALVAVRAVARLLGKEEGDEAARADDEAFATILASNNEQWAYSFGACLAMVTFLLDDLATMDRWQAAADARAPAGANLFSEPDYVLFKALRTTRLWGRLAESDRPAALASVDAAIQRLGAWAGACPDNFRHKHLLLLAEQARVTGEPLDRAVSLYEEVVEIASGRFPHLAALALELSADLWEERGQPRLARTARRDAYAQYAQWGALGKLRALEDAHPDLFVNRSAADKTPPDAEGSTSTTADGPAALDVASVLKATRAISLEVRADKVFAALMDTVLENAGAERALLLLESDATHGWCVEAEANVEGGARATGSIPIESAIGLSPDIVRYVARTREILVLQDAAREGPFRNDAYVRGRGVRSVLCMPIVNAGRLVGVLYAENNAATCAFTKQRLGILHVIAGQAAVSIGNALLYSHLERKVEERTQELAQMNREIAAMLDGMEQGIFTIDEELTFEPKYSRHLESILGTKEIAGQPCLPRLFRGARIAPDALSTMETALRFSFGAPGVLADANAPHLVRRFERDEADGTTRHFEVDWSFIVGDEDLVSKVLTVVRDVTLLTQLKETADAKSREAEIVGQILDSGIERFEAFCETTRALLEQNRTLVTATADLTVDVVRALFRNVHSVKGNARLFGFRPIVEAVHEAEGTYDALRRGDRVAADRPRLVAHLDAILAVLSEYERVCAERLHAAGRAEHARLERALGEIEAATAADGADPREALACVRRSLRELRAIPLADVVRETGRIVPSLADELQKPAPEIDCDARGVLLRPEWADVLRDAFVQIFRNAMAHGLENETERATSGKPVRGLIRVRAEWAHNDLRIAILDDGRGLALDELRLRIGRPSSADDDVAQAVFASGVSTFDRASLVAGRGVGMDLVRSNLRSRGGDIDVAFTGGASHGYRPFEWVLTIPGAGAVTAALSSRYAVSGTAPRESWRPGPMAASQGQSSEK